MDPDISHHHFAPLFAATALPGPAFSLLRHLGAPQKTHVLQRLGARCRCGAPVLPDKWWSSTGKDGETWWISGILPWI